MKNKLCATTIRKAARAILDETDRSEIDEMANQIISCTHYISKGIKDLPRAALEELAKLFGYREKYLGMVADMELIVFIENSMEE